MNSNKTNNLKPSLIIGVITVIVFTLLQFTIGVCIDKLPRLMLGESVLYPKQTVFIFAYAFSIIPCIISFFMQRKYQAWGIIITLLTLFICYYISTDFYYFFDKAYRRGF